MSWSGAITLLFSQPSSDSATTTSASFTPPADSLEFVQHSHSANGHSTVPDVQISNTGGLTFGRSVTDVVDFAGPNDIQGALFAAPVGGSPSSMTVTVDPFPTTDAAYQSMAGFAVTEGEILQGPVGRIVVDGATTHTTAALPVATTSGNLVIAGFSTHTTGGVAASAPSGFTLLVAQDTNYQMQSIFYSTTHVGTTVTCPDLGESLYVTASWIIEIETPSAPPTGAYTELEWNVGVQAPAVADEVYEFRVYAGDTPLTDYLITAQLSVESAGGGVNYNETGRSITIAATTTATDQADWKSNVGLSIPVVATTTATAQYDNRELALSIPIVGTTTETSQADFKELGLSVPVVATTTTTAQYDHRELALAIPITAATTLAVDQADFKEVGTAGSGLLTSIAAVVTATDVHNVAGAGYNETNRSILITAAVTVPTEQADFKDLALSVPGVATVTLPIDRYERYDLDRSVAITATITTPTDRANRKELALSVPVTATVTATDLIKRGELGKSVPVVATVTETDQADWKSNVGLSVPVVGTVTVPTDKLKTFETALSVPVVATTTSTDQADFKNLALGLSITAFVTCTDNQQSPGHYEDTGLPISIAATVATVTEQTDYKDLARSVPVVATTTVTALKHFYATGLSIPVVATVASTALHKRFEPLALPVVSTVALLTDQADFKDLTRSVNVAATITITEGFGGAIETGRQILITATVSRTDRADFNDLLALGVGSQITLTDQADYHQLLTVLILSTIRATDLQRYINGVVLNTALALYLGDIPVQKVYCGSVQVWP